MFCRDVYSLLVCVLKFFHINIAKIEAEIYIESRDLFILPTCRLVLLLFRCWFFYVHVTTIKAEI